MSSLNNLSLFLYTLGLVTLTATTQTAASKDYYLYHNCTGSAFAHNSSYQLNLNSLLSSLSSNAATGSSSTGFYNTTVGSDKHSSDTIYGLFMCRGDLAPQLCKECVINATKELATYCAMKKEALKWYDKCLVRYSNTAFFSTMDERPQKRNASSSSHRLHRGDDLLNYAWRQWKEQTPLELLDPSLEGCYSEIEGLRCIQIGLLCVQEDPDERPTMATVTLMLNSDSLDLPLPGHPAFFACSRTGSNLSNELDPAQSATHSVPLSINEMSMTNFSPRS